MIQISYGSSYKYHCFIDQSNILYVLLQVNQMPFLKKNKMTMLYADMTLLAIILP
jgi:hypothetical protein